ncbi:MAG TPA: hypothetical protein VHG53_04165 [Candidatus Limnocylindria bacterium]|nr:hypothetical protein [Candidatus Limnocylindria bacterium]
MIASIALAGLFFCAGTQTPSLALLALRRPRIPALVVTPYAATLGAALLIAPGLGATAQIGVRAVALAPALLAAPILAAASGGRLDRTGALTVGALAAAALVNALGGPGSAQLGSVLVAFFIGAAMTAAIPMVPDAVRTLTRRAQDLAYLTLAAVAIVAGGPAVDLAAVLAALILLAAGLASAAIVALATGVDPVSALLGVGSRDPAIAAAVAVGAGSPAAAAVPLAYGTLVVALAAFLAARQRLRARDAGPTILA